MSKLLKTFGGVEIHHHGKTFYIRPDKKNKMAVYYDRYAYLGLTEDEAVAVIEEATGNPTIG